MTALLLIALGGGAGAMLRYAVQRDRKSVV